MQFVLHIGILNTWHKLLRESTKPYSNESMSWSTAALSPVGPKAFGSGLNSSSNAPNEKNASGAKSPRIRAIHKTLTKSKQLDGRHSQWCEKSHGEPDAR